MSPKYNWKRYCVPREGRFALDSQGFLLPPARDAEWAKYRMTDAVAIEEISDSVLKVVRQEFEGQISTHVTCDLSTGGVITIRPGAFRPVESPAISGTVIDKSSEIGELRAGRRYLETVAAEASDVDITKHDILVSIGRGIQEKDNIAIAEELAENEGAVALLDGVASIGIGL